MKWVIILLRKHDRVRKTRCLADEAWRLAVGDEFLITRQMLRSQTPFYRSLIGFAFGLRTKACGEQRFDVKRAKPQTAQAGLSSRDQF
jgi:hypothetical protein